MNALSKKTVASKRREALPVQRRKNVRLDQRKLAAAQRILGAKTETDTIEQALDLVIFREEAIAGMTRLVGKGGFEDVFPGDEEP